MKTTRTKKTDSNCIQTAGGKFPPAVSFLQRGAVVLTQADDKTAALVVGKVQLLGKGRHTAAALDVELRHQATVCGVVPGVNDGTVGLGRAAADVLLLLYYKNFRVIPRKLPRTGAPGHARTDNDDPTNYRNITGL